MTVDEMVARFEPWRRKHSKTAYAPRLGIGRTRSRFGGEPDMRADEPWPTCRSCKQPMRFLVQLELAASPLGGEGLLQLFYCSTDDGACETWAPFSGTSVARLVDGELTRRTSPVEKLRERVIVGWDAFDDFPNSQALESLGLHAEYDFDTMTAHITCADIGFDEANLDIDTFGVEAISSAADGDKLLGWPRWVQGDESPPCPRCNARMELVLQLDSEAGLALMFGDAGIGHITQCPKHPHELAFGWACS